MKNFRALFLLISVLPGFLFFSACKKKGCTDNDATNYDSKATDDCSCCQYGKMVFYSSKDTYYDTASHKSYKIKDVKITANDDTITVIKPYTAGKPDCSTAGTLIHQLQAGETDVFVKVHIDFVQPFVMDYSFSIIFAGGAKCSAYDVWDF